MILNIECISLETKERVFQHDTTNNKWEKTVKGVISKVSFLIASSLIPGNQSISKVTKSNNIKLNI